MSEIESFDAEEPGSVQPSEQDEMAALKERAALMGLRVSNNIGIETLRKKISDKLAGVGEAGDGGEANEVDEVNPLVEPGEQKLDANLTPMQLRERLMKDAMRLIRVRITNLDPKKKDLNGEIITVANEFIGNVSKFVPFGEASDGGYHIPKVLFDELDSRRFLNIRSVRDPITKQERIETTYAKEFALEVLRPLSQKELDKLAADQRAAGE